MITPHLRPYPLRSRTSSLSSGYFSVPSMVQVISHDESVHPHDDDEDDVGSYRGIIESRRELLVGL